MHIVEAGKVCMITEYYVELLVDSVAFLKKGDVAMHNW